MWNYYASIVRYGAKTTLHINLFGGPEKTHLAYEGIPKAYLDGEITGDPRNDRRYNPLEYPNEIDQFFQPHYQLIHNWQISRERRVPEHVLLLHRRRLLPAVQVRSLVSGVRTRAVSRSGRRDSSTPPIWCGGARSTNGTAAGSRTSNGATAAGAASSRSGPPSDSTAAATSERSSGPSTILPISRPTTATTTTSSTRRPLQPFIQENWHFNEKWNLLAGLTWTSHRYDMHDDQINDVEFDISYSYLLPEARSRLSTRPSGGASTATSPAAAASPPFATSTIRRTYWTPPPQDLEPEKLTDFELGARYSWTTGGATLNLYYLDFDNAIVWAGGLDNNGNPVTANGAVTEHKGVELDLNWAPLPRWSGRLSLAWADNTIVDFVEYGWDGEDDRPLRATRCR